MNTEQLSIRVFPTPVPKTLQVKMSENQYWCKWLSVSAQKLKSGKIGIHNPKIFFFYILQFGVLCIKFERNVEQSKNIVVTFAHLATGYWKMCAKGFCIPNSIEKYEAQNNGMHIFPTSPGRGGTPRKTVEFLSFTICSQEIYNMYNERKKL